MTVYHVKNLCLSFVCATNFQPYTLHSPNSYHLIPSSLITLNSDLRVFLLITTKPKLHAVHIYHPPIMYQLDRTRCNAM